MERAVAALTVRFTWQRFVKAVRFRGPVNLVEEAYRVIYNYTAPVVEIRFGASNIALEKRAIHQFSSVLAQLLSQYEPPI